MVPRPYVRVYYEDLERDYPEIFDDDAAVAAWLRLLVIVDKMWPVRPELPASVRGRTLALLTKSKLVTLVPPRHYRIRGYEAERLDRQEKAQRAATKRWQSGSNARSNADAHAHAYADAHARRMPSTEYRVPSTEISKENGEKRARGMLEPIASILPRTLP